MIALPNTQPTEKQDYRFDDTLDIIHCWKTVQGEGPFAGVPAVFLRTAGCDLCCPGCDTDYTTLRHRVDTSHLRDSIIAAADGSATLVVITGGEPLRQNLNPLIEELVKYPPAYRVQIETNGTMFQELPGSILRSSRVTIVCSPKTPTINADLTKYIAAMKYVVRAGEIDPYDGLPTSVLGNGLKPARPNPSLIQCDQVYVQPMDEGNRKANKANTQAALESCLKYGYRFSLQVHKLVGLP